MENRATLWRNCWSSDYEIARRLTDFHDPRVKILFHQDIWLELEKYFVVNAKPIQVNRMQRHRTGQSNARCNVDNGIYYFTSLSSSLCAFTWCLNHINSIQICTTGKFGSTARKLHLTNTFCSSV